MPSIGTHVTATIAAAPEQVYAVFADYRSAHPQILPRPYFIGLEVEQGGYGAGTVFRAFPRSFGTQRTLRMAVTEPEPGRVLVETDLASDLVTTFTITPTDDPQRTQVRIATQWSAKPGIAGLLDRLMTPPILRMVYRKELGEVQRYLARQLAPVQ